MLRAAWEVLKPGGRLSFYAIEIPDGLTAAEREAGRLAGPIHVQAGAPYEDLLSRAGFDSVTAEDVSRLYLEAAETRLGQWLLHEGELRVITGDEEYEERIEMRQGAVAGIRAGLLGRSLYLAAK